MAETIRAKKEEAQMTVSEADVVGCMFIVLVALFLYNLYGPDDGGGGGYGGYKP